MLNVDKYTDLITQLFTLLQNSNTFHFITNIGLSSKNLLKKVNMHIKHNPHGVCTLYDVSIVELNMWLCCNSVTNEVYNLFIRLLF